MAKQALGRNLGALLDGGSTAAPPLPAGSGVRTLMRGQAPAAEARPSIPRWYLFGGDLLLTALALIIVCKSPRPVSVGREIFCGIAVALGACLGLLGIWPANSAEPLRAGAGVAPHRVAPKKFGNDETQDADSGQQQHFAR